MANIILVRVRNIVSPCARESRFGNTFGCKSTGCNSLGTGESGVRLPAHESIRQEGQFQSKKIQKIRKRGNEQAVTGYINVVTGDVNNDADSGSADIVLNDDDAAT
jgi:hypothetical protein